MKSLCTGCNRWLERTSENFNASKKSPDGLDTRCKDCVRARRRAEEKLNPRPSRRKTPIMCSKCGKNPRSKNSYWCRECRNEYNRAYRIENPIWGTSAPDCPMLPSDVDRGKRAFFDGHPVTHDELREIAKCVQMEDGRWRCCSCGMPHEYERQAENCCAQAKVRVPDEWSDTIYRFVSLLVDKGFSGDRIGDILKTTEYQIRKYLKRARKELMEREGLKTDGELKGHMRSIRRRYRAFGVDVAIEMRHNARGA